MKVMESNEKKSWDQANQQGKNQTDFNHEGSDNNFSEEERVERNQASDDDSLPQFGTTETSESNIKNAGGNDFDEYGINPVAHVSYTEYESDNDAKAYNALSSSENENSYESDRELDRQVL